MTAHPALVTELEHAIAQRSAERRAEMVLKVTDLFIHGSPNFTDDEINLFDDIISRLATEIEVSVRALLAHRLAPIANAPLNVTRMLASDDEIKVAYPILAESERLDEATLVLNALTKSQDHLLAISQRKSLSEVVTDVLLDRGNKQVVLSIAKNPAAKFSNAGFSLLVKHSEGDDVLAVSVGMRPDIPRHLFLTLLASASEIVRTKLIVQNPQCGREIDRAVAVVTEDLQARTGSTNYAAAEALIRSLHDSRQLGDETVRAFAEDGKFEETTAAIARICNLPLGVVEQAMIQDRSEAILVLAKAAGLSWATAKVVLSFRAGHRRISADEIEQCLASFERLNFGTAQQITEFYRMRRAVGKSFS